MNSLQILSFSRFYIAGDDVLTVEGSQNRCRIAAKMTPCRTLKAVITASLMMKQLLHGQLVWTFQAIQAACRRDRREVISAVTLIFLAYLYRAMLSGITIPTSGGTL